MAANALLAPDIYQVEKEWNEDIMYHLSVNADNVQCNNGCIIIKEPLRFSFYTAQCLAYNLLVTGHHGRQPFAQVVR